MTKYRVTNTGPSLAFHPDGQPSVIIPHTADGRGVLLELPDELVAKLAGGNHRDVHLSRVADHDQAHEPAITATGVRVIVRDRLDWPQHGFELKAGVTDVESLEAWIASIPTPVRPKLAPFVRSEHVQLLDLGTNLRADVSAAAVAQLEEI